MKSILIAGNVAYPTAAADFNAVGAGAIGIFTNGSFLAVPGSGDPTFGDTLSFVLGRSVANGGPISIQQIDKRNFRYNKATYIAATTYTSKLTIATATADKLYTIVVIKKGCQFNERCVFTNVYLAKEGDTVTTIAAALVAQINNNKDTTGLGAANTAGAITFTAVKAGTDYEVKGSDSLAGVELANVTVGMPAFADKAYVQDLASQCAADRGFNSTCPEGGNLNPNYPMEVAAASYTIYNIYFNNPHTGTSNTETVNCHLIIAVPTGAGLITSLDALLSKVK